MKHKISKPKLNIAMHEKVINCEQVIDAIDENNQAHTSISNVISKQHLSNPPQNQLPSSHVLPLAITSPKLPISNHHHYLPQAILQQ
jgi:hypothetical protein